MRRLHGLGKSTLIMRTHPELGFGAKRRIDIWSRGEEGNADLMLLLAHILLQHGDWQEAEIRLIRVVATEAGISKIITHMTDMINRVRVSATPIVLTPDSPGESIKSIVKRNSGETDLTFWGMQAPSINDTAEYAAELEKMANDLGAVLLVHNGQPFNRVLSEES